MTLEQIDILDVWASLGGGALRGHRGKAFWRGGDRYSIAIDAKKNVWYDHRDARGGGVLDLVRIATGYTKPDALKWLEMNCGLDPRRPLSLAEKRQYAVQAAGTERLAQRLADFAHGLELITEKTVVDLHSAMVATGIDAPETIGQYQRQLCILKTVHPRDIAYLWRNAQTAALEVERIGREHREHAECVTKRIVEILAIKARRGLSLVAA